jgi:alpha-beta hydrolase superfamily lysophospholipase
MSLWQPCRSAALDQIGLAGRLPDPWRLRGIAKPIWASDPKSADLGGRVRAPWGRLTGWPEPNFDAGNIKMPTLVIRGDSDTLATREDNQQLLEDLGSAVKQCLEVEQASHLI